MQLFLTTLLLAASTAHAVPAQFTHQGRLLDADGAPLEGDATVIVRITDAEMGGTALWEETITVSLTNGFYSAVLGADEDGNPLDSDTLSQAPVWLELQLEGEPAMFPRSAINAVPYATMATVAEEVSGGPVDASQIAISGSPVVNESGEWVGPSPTVNWSDIDGMPEGFADGIDDDAADSFAALGTSCIDGDIPVWDATLIAWVCGTDLTLSDAEVDAIVSDNGYAMSSELFTGSFLDLDDVPEGLDDGDSTLTEEDVDAMVSDNGYAMAADAFSRNFSDLESIPDGLLDGDDNTQLTEEQVDEMVSNNDYAFITDVFSGYFTDLFDIPDGLEDGDDDTLDTLACSDGQVPVYESSSDYWICGDLAASIRVTRISPTAAPLDETTSITVYGGIFSPQLSRITVGGVELTDVTFVNETQVQGTLMGFDLPEAGDYDVYIEEEGGEQATLPNAYAAGEATPLTVEDFEISAFPDYADLTYTVSGTGFLDPMTVTVGDESVTATVLSTTELEFTVPALSAGEYDVVFDRTADESSATVSDGYKNDYACPSGYSEVLGKDDGYSSYTASDCSSDEHTYWTQWPNRENPTALCKADSCSFVNAIYARYPGGACNYTNWRDCGYRIVDPI